MNGPLSFRTAKRAGERKQGRWLAWRDTAVPPGGSGIGGLAAECWALGEIALPRYSHTAHSIIGKSEASNL